MDAAIPADAQNAPTGIWKSRTEREIPTAPTPIIVVVNERKNNGDSNNVAKPSTESDQAQRSDWVLVVMDQFTRRLVGVGVHRGPVTGADLCRMFNAAIHGRGAPRHLSTDHDPLFEAHRWTANLRILEIDEVKTVPHVPRSHPFVERLIGTTAARISRPCAVLEYP